MPKNILITGAARRVGAHCAQYLHSCGHNIIIHYHHSAAEAQSLCAELNRIRPHSAQALQADLLDLNALKALAEQAIAVWGGIDCLINNASSFYAQPVAAVTENDWEQLLGSNLKAPFFLAQALSPTLTEREGCIINIVDIHAERALKGYPVYSIAKAGLAAMTKALAKELAPAVRVNAVAPGAVLWPEQANALAGDEQQAILQRIALKRAGSPQDIAKAVRFLLDDAAYITGQILTVDGGRTLFY